MARVELPIVVLNSSTGLPVVGASVVPTFRATGAAATWYPGESTGTGSTAAIITDAYGRTSAWFPRGAYNLAVSGTGITPYTEPWDAATAVDGGIDAAWIPNNSISNTKLLSDLDAAKLTTGTMPIARIAPATVTYDKLAVSAAMRPLAQTQLTTFAVGANSSASIGSVVATHNNRPAYAMLIHSGYVSGGVNGGCNWTILVDGSTAVTPFSASVGNNFPASVSYFGSLGTYSGAHTWSVTVSLANNPVTFLSYSIGTLVIFEV